MSQNCPNKCPTSVPESVPKMTQESPEKCPKHIIEVPQNVLSLPRKSVRVVPSTNWKKSMLEIKGKTINTKQIKVTRKKREINGKHMGNEIPQTKDNHNHERTKNKNIKFMQYPRLGTFGFPGYARIVGTSSRFPCGQIGDLWYSWYSSYDPTSFLSSGNVAVLCENKVTLESSGLAFYSVQVCLPPRNYKCWLQASRNISILVVGDYTLPSLTLTITHHKLP